MVIIIIVVIIIAVVIIIIIIVVVIIILVPARLYGGPDVQYSTGIDTVLQLFILIPLKQTVVPFLTCLGQTRYYRSPHPSEHRGTAS